MNKDSYDFYKNAGICTHCRKEKAFNGTILCLSCLIENRKYKKKYDSKKQKKIDSEKYKYRKENGLCTVCGKNLQFHGLKCKSCYSKYLIRKDAQKSNITRAERPSYGLCYTCGKLELVLGKRVCSSCYEKRVSCISKIMYMPVTGPWENANNIVFVKKERE